MKAKFLNDKQAIAGIREYLGKGYRGYEYYADPRSITTALFDLAELKSIEVQEAPSYEGRFVYGQSKKEYFEKLSASIHLEVSYSGFSGEVTGSFSEQTLINTNNVFATSNVTQAYYRLSLTDEAILTPRAIDDIAKFEPFALFEKYGTHYLKSVFIGARVSFSSYADITKVSKNFDMSTTVKAAYTEVVKGEASSSSVRREDLQEVSNNSHIRVMGGDPAKANAIIEGTGVPSENYRAWSESVPNYVSIADFDKNGLVPIYRLAATPERRSELEKAWKTYMDEHTNDILKKEDPKPKPVYKNSRIKLLSSGDRYITTAESATRYYYAKLGQDNGVVLKLGGNQKPLVGGSVVSIKTTEKFKKSWQTYNLLGAFGDATELYYWKDYGSKTNWIIEKIEPNQNGAPISDSEQVYIKNEAYTDQYLAPHTNNYLTTKKGKKHKWRIELE
jgi:hypothetical protein